tara:strand:+ start:447 stop:827 length:381 start_codon:yes stop_codon:yes gene_type:complete
MFILIIFFLATATFSEEETDHSVNLPDSSVAPTTLSAKTKTITINVRADGTYLINNPVSGRRDRMELEGMREELSSALQENPGQKVLVRGDRKALHEAVANAMACCKEVGFHDANIGYQYKLSAEN